MKAITLKRRKKTMINEETALQLGLIKKDFSFYNQTEEDCGNCLTIKNCAELLDIQVKEKSDKQMSMNVIWNEILSGVKVDEKNVDAINFINFLNNMRFLKVADHYLLIMPREIPLNSLSYEVTLMIKFGINVARMARYKRSRPKWVETYKKSNINIMNKIRTVHFQSSFSKQFKLLFKNKIGSRLQAVTSMGINLFECRIDYKTLKLLNKRIGDDVLVGRDPIITVMGWTLKIVGLCSQGKIEVRPEILTSLCGDTDGDGLFVVHYEDKVQSIDVLKNILSFYKLEIGTYKGEPKGITNEEIINEEKHSPWNVELSNKDIKDKMDMQALNLGYVKSATQRCGYWAIIMSQYISEHIDHLAESFDESINDVFINYRILLFKIQQALVDAKHSDGDISLSLEYKVTDTKLKFNSDEDIISFLNGMDNYNDSII